MPKPNSEITKEKRTMDKPNNFRYQLNLATQYAMEVANRYHIDFDTISSVEVKPGGQNDGTQTITIVHVKVLNDADIRVTTVIEEYDVA